MVQRTLPGIGLTGFWPLGYDGWNTEMDANLRLLSLLVQARAISRTTALPESDAAQGDIYIVAPYDSAGPDSGDPAEDFVVIFDDDVWVEYEPVEGWKFFLDDEQIFVVYRGSEGWVEFQAGEGGSVAADGVSYDNGSSGLTSDNAQDAIDEIVEIIDGLDPGGSGGSGFLFRPPLVANFGTEVLNATSGSEVDDADLGLHLLMVPNSGTDSWFYRLKIAPIAPFVMTCGIRVTSVNTAGGFGLAIRNSSSEEYARIILRPGSSIVTQNNNGTNEITIITIATGPATPIVGTTCYLRISVDGSGNIAFFYSSDGATWIPLGTSTVAGILGGTLNQVGFVLRSTFGVLNIVGGCVFYYDD